MGGVPEQYGSPNFLLFNIFSNIVLHTARNFAVFLAEILYRTAASEFLQQAPAQMHMEFTGTISFGLLPSPISNYCRRCQNVL